MTNIPMYLRPKQVESKIGISVNILNDLKDVVFKEGVHYFIPMGLTYVLWNRDSLLDWINGNESNEINSLVNDILKN